MALEGAQRGLAGGLRTTIDVLDAVRRLYLARRDFVQSRYEVLLARLRLQALAGLPVQDVVRDIDAHLTAPLSSVTVARAAFSPAASRPAVAEGPHVAASPDPRVSAGDSIELVLAAIEEWRDAWSARDAARYLSAYSPEFRPDGGLSRTRWEAQRRARLASAAFIHVGVRDAEVSVGPAQATVVFTQSFESDVFRDTGRKTLVFENQDGRWLIRQESFEK